MNIQEELQLEIAHAVAISEIIREEHAKADRKAEAIRGIRLIIDRYETALMRNTYPFIGAGEHLRPEHRQPLEDQVAAWRRELAALEAENSQAKTI